MRAAIGDIIKGDRCAEINNQLQQNITWYQGIIKHQDITIANYKRENENLKTVVNNKATIERVNNIRTVIDSGKIVQLSTSLLNSNKINEQLKKKISWLHIKEYGLWIGLAAAAVKIFILK